MSEAIEKVMDVLKSHLFFDKYKVVYLKNNLVLRAGYMDRNGNGEAIFITEVEFRFPVSVDEFKEFKEQYGSWLGV